MAKITCPICGREYEYSPFDCCPDCGAINPPPEQEEAARQPLPVAAAVKQLDEPKKNRCEDEAQASSPEHYQPAAEDASDQERETPQKEERGERIFSGLIAWGFVLVMLMGILSALASSSSENVSNDFFIVAILFGILLFFEGILGSIVSAYMKRSPGGSKRKGIPAFALAFALGWLLMLSGVLLKFAEGRIPFLARFSGIAGKAVYYGLKLGIAGFLGVWAKGFFAGFFESFFRKRKKSRDPLPD